VHNKLSYRRETARQLRHVFLDWLTEKQHFFSERVVDRLNGLDQCVIDSATVNSFKNGLRRLANATKQDGLLRGLICSAWLYIGLTWF